MFFTIGGLMTYSRLPKHEIFIKTYLDLYIFTQDIKLEINHMTDIHSIKYKYKIQKCMFAMRYDSTLAQM